MYRHDPELKKLHIPVSAGHAPENPDFIKFHIIATVAELKIHGCEQPILAKKQGSPLQAAYEIFMSDSMLAALCPTATLGHFTNFRLQVNSAGNMTVFLPDEDGFFAGKAARKSATGADLRAARTLKNRKIKNAREAPRSVDRPIRAYRRWRPP